MRTVILGKIKNGDLTWRPPTSFAGGEAPRSELTNKAGDSVYFLDPVLRRCVFGVKIVDVNCNRSDRFFSSMQSHGIQRGSTKRL